MTTVILLFLIASLFIWMRRVPRVRSGGLAGPRVGALITVITIAAGILVLVVEVKVARGAEWGAAVPPSLDTIVTVTPVRPGRPARVFRVVLLCDTAEKQRQGLQGFRRLAPDEAALFPYPTPAEVTFWMGSVSFPIDIIFVAPDRTVRRVQRDCRPRQTDLFPSGGPVRWVFETAAGSGVRAGDRVDVTGPGAQGHSSPGK